MSSRSQSVAYAPEGGNSPPSGAGAYRIGSELLSVRNMAKRFGAVVALDGVSLDLAVGEIWAICGENGAGKSTLVKILAGIYHADAGSVTFAGRSCTIGQSASCARTGYCAGGTGIERVPRSDG